MPPEIMFEENLNFCADYFSLGVICYELLMGQIPYQSKSLEEMKKLIMANQVQIKNLIFQKDGPKLSRILLIN